ncbi:hypothetical protein TrVE_jg1990 [Triparma verrucosa]|uniref:Uncharacterized protein n=1 Tax=Triparma verrucosa TaxID=1606542 RepID=A0A9W7BQJ5_9STRA|nr:hypothetical protein TrVE_jg1990 [Triparma verrucosa]
MLKLFNRFSRSSPHTRTLTSTIFEPTPEEKQVMLDQTTNFLNNFHINNPSPIAGSGHAWIGSSAATEEQDVVLEKLSALDLRIHEDPIPLKSVLADVLDPAARLSMDDRHPGYLAFVPSGGLFHSAIADYIASNLNRYVTINQAAPALAQIESECVSFLCSSIANYPPSTSGGVLTTGGSMANMLAIHLSRREALGNKDLPNATLYVSEQSHYCVAQAARFVGLIPKHIKVIPSDPKTLKMDTSYLRSVVQSDIFSSLTPIAICATAGTTNTGAVDDIAACRAIADEFDTWLHVDAAYGGAFAITETGRNVLGDLSVADSLVVDPHKGLFLPYGLGALLVKDQKKLLRANHEDGACMQPTNFFDTHGEAPFVDTMNLSPELTRDFRGLKLWLPLRLIGVQPFRDALEEKLALAAKAAAKIEAAENTGHLKLLHPPQLSVFTFKYDDPSKKGAELDALQLELLNKIHVKGRCLLSLFRSINGADGELCLRMCVLSHRTDEAAVEAAVQDIIASARQMWNNE